MIESAQSAIAYTPGVAAVLRSEQAFADQVCRRQALECGWAYYRPESPSLPDCNFLGDATLPEDARLALAEVESFYASMGLECRRWVAGVGTSAARLEALLGPQGFLRIESRCYVLASPPAGGNVASAQTVRILSARAMRRAYRAVLAEECDELTGTGCARSAVRLEHLDDPSYDAFVAVVGGRAAGAVALHQVGEIGRIRDLYVCPAHRRQGIARGLVRYAIQTAVRWRLRPICTLAQADVAGLDPLLRGTGFSPDGTLIEFVQPAARRPA